MSVFSPFSSLAYTDSLNILPPSNCATRSLRQTTHLHSQTASADHRKRRPPGRSNLPLMAQRRRMICRDSTSLDSVRRSTNSPTGILPSCHRLSSFLTSINPHRSSPAASATCFSTQSPKPLLRPTPESFGFSRVQRPYRGHCRGEDEIER